MKQMNMPTGLRLVFPEKQSVQLEPFDLPPLQDGEVLVRTDVSLMSTGTENIVFNQLFDPGTHWDRWVKYPFYPGYSAVGTVERVGSSVSSLKVGDRVAARIFHQSLSVISEDACIVVPPDIPSEEAVWFALAKIAFMGARAARYELGDSVLIVGAGPIGQMSIRWARAAGAASICSVDSLAPRLAMARAGGATVTIDRSLAEARETVLKDNHGRPPRIIVDSTGNSTVLTAALGLVADHGRVVLVGDTGRPSEQTLTSDVITRGLSIIGAFDVHMTADWNEHTISRLFFNLISTGRFSMKELNTHFFTPDECKVAYDTVNRDRANTMGVLFDWEQCH